MAEEIVEAPLMGRVVRVHIEEGNPVKEGDPLCDIESLKMEILIVAPVGGTIKAIQVAPGQEVRAGDPLVVIEG